MSADGGESAQELREELAEYRERIDQLEAQVEDQQSTIERMLPSRRQVLTAAAGVGGFALGAGSASAADTTDGRHAAKFGQYKILEIDDAAADPSANGEIQRNGGDIKAYSGGSVRNLSNIGAGGLWTEDGNSPFTASSVSSKQFTLASNWDRVLLLPAHDNTGFDQLQVNGDTGTNYSIVKNGDGTDGSLSEWQLGIWTDRIDHIKLVANPAGSEVQLVVQPSTSNTGVTVYGDNTAASPPISTFTVKDGGGSNRSVKLEAYGLNVG